MKKLLLLPVTAAVLMFGVAQAIAYTGEKNYRDEFPPIPNSPGMSVPPRVIEPEPDLGEECGCDEAACYYTKRDGCTPPPKVKPKDKQRK